MDLFFGYHYSMATYWQTYHAGGITQLSLDFSNRCNYRCDWCFNSRLLDQEEELLTLDERKQLLQNAVHLGAKTLVIPGTGEPTLDPEFQATVEVAYELGLITVVYTNLTGRLDASLIRWLKQHNVSLGVKLDSLKKEYFLNRYHTSERSYELFMTNLAQAVEIYGETSVQMESGNTAHRIIANLVLTKENAPELEEISLFCRDRGLPLFVRPVKPVDWASCNPELWRKLGNKSGSPCPEKKLFELSDEYNTFFSPSATEENHCAIFSFGLTVKSDGSVQLCPDHHASCGMFNIKRDKLKDIVSHLLKMRPLQPGYCICQKKA